MRKYVIDASVVVKWVSRQREEDRETALLVYDKMLDGEISASAPTFLLIEVINILSIKKKLSSAVITSVIRNLLALGIQFEELLPDDVIEIIDFVHAHHITAYDAHYVFLAKKLQCELITVDRQLLKLKGITVEPSVV